MKQSALALLFLLSSGLCLAQTTQCILPGAVIKATYHSKPDWPCSSASIKPIQSFSQFICAIPLVSNGKTIGSYSFSGSSHVFALNVPGLTQPSSGAIKQLKTFTKPSFGKYGQLVFTFEVIDAKGGDHKGSVSASWQSIKPVPPYWKPVIISSTVTLTQ